MTKIDKVIKHIRNRLRSHGQPQIFGLPEMHRALKEKRHIGGGSYIDNALGAIRRAGALKEVGKIRGGHYYVFKRAAIQKIERDPEVIRRWIYGKETV